MMAHLKHGIRDFLSRRLGVPEIPSALERLRNCNFDPVAIFDVGAYSGEFARNCRRVWPRASLTCFEVLPARVQELRAWCTSDGRASVVNCLLGAAKRDAVPFHEMETASSVLEEHIPQVAHVKTFPMTTIDAVLETTISTPPDLLKLDVQGYELEVLKGAERALRQISVVLAEVNFIDIHVGVPLFDEILLFMRDSGFVAYDICGLSRRPLDNALWQADFIFVRRDSKLRVDKRWQS